MSRWTSFLTLTALLFSSAGFAQTLAERGTLLDQLAGRWVMTGVIAGDDIVHDISAEWVLGGHYLYVHERARELDATGKPAYEARIYIGWDEENDRFVCLWLDVTGGGGLVPGGFGYARPEADRLPFVWGEGTDSGIHNTFAYEAEQDRWTWQIDNIREGQPSNFARVSLNRDAVAVATDAARAEDKQGILDTIARLSDATVPGGGGVDAYAAVLAEGFSRWTLNGEDLQRREAAIEGIWQWLDEGWRVSHRESHMIDSTVRGDRAYTHRVVTEMYRDSEGEVSGPSTFALEETWRRVEGRWLLNQATVYPISD
jgi:hypothetical protein